MNVRHERVHAMPADVTTPNTSDAGEMRPPRASGWRENSRHPAKNYLEAIAASVWQRRGVLVLSTLENAEYPDGSGEVGPQWHVSISTAGGRSTELEIKQALLCFDFEGTEEDNHHPGRARHFWKPVDPKRRVECECKSTETVVVDPADGYRWSMAAEHCGGCEIAPVTGKPCPVHGGARPSIEELIAKSSIGEGLRDIAERGIDAHLADPETKP